MRTFRGDLADLSAGDFVPFNCKPFGDYGEVTDDALDGGASGTAVVPAVAVDGDYKLVLDYRPKKTTLSVTLDGVAAGLVEFPLEPSGAGVVGVDYLTGTLQFHEDDATAEPAKKVVATYEHLGTVVDMGSFNQFQKDLDAAAQAATFDGLTDTDPTGKADGDVVTWDADTGKYVLQAPIGGAVDSVNGQTGEVVLGADDITYDAGAETVAQSLGNLYFLTGNVDPSNLTGAVPVTKGGTGLTALGNAGDVLKVNGDGDGLEWAEAIGGGGGSVSWGGINGILSDQTDLQSALDAKQDELTGLTASVSELNILDGAILTTTELNYVDGVTSAIQDQLDAKAALTTALGVVNHGSTASTARPSGYTVVQWIGSVEPENAVDGDTWLDTSGA